MRSLALSKKNLLIAISVLVFPVFVYGGTPTIAILNPYTGRLDLINKLSSTSIDELVDVDTGAATAGDCLVYNTYASSSVWEPGSCGTGGGGGTSTYNSTVTISIGAGGDAYQSTNTFAPIPGASFVMSRSTLTTIGLMAYTLYPSTVASTFFKLALTTSPDTGTPWTYISPILEVATSMKYSNYYSTVFVVNDRQAIALHCSSLAATGITPSEYGVKLDGYVQSAFGGIPIIAASGVGGGSLFVEPANVAVSTIVFANGDFIFVSDGVAGGTMTVKNSSGSWSAAQTFISSTTFSSSTINIGGIVWFVQSSASASGDQILHRIGDTNQVFWGGDGGTGGGGGGGSALFIQPDNVSISSMVLYYGDLNFVSDGVSGGTLTVKDSSGEWTAAQTFVSSVTIISTSIARGGFYVTGKIQAGRSDESSINVPLYVRGYSPTAGAGNGMAIYIINSDNTSFLGLGFTGNVAGNRDILMRTSGSGPRSLHINASNDTSTQGDIILNTDGKVLFLESITTLDSAAVTSNMTVGGAMMVVDSFTVAGASFCIGGTCYVYQATAPLTGFFFFDEASKRVFTVTQTPGSGSGDGGSALFVQPNNVSVSSIVFRNGDFIFVSDGVSGGTMTVKNSSGSWSAAQTFISSTTFSSSTLNIGGVVNFFQSTVPAEGDLILHRIGNTNQVFWGGDGGSGSSAGGIQASLAVGTGSFVAMNVVSSPTFALNFDSGAFRTSLVTGATAFVTIGTNAIDGLSTIPYSAVLRYSSATGMAMWDTPHPREFYWGGASLLAVSTSNSPNVAPVVKTTATYGDVMGASYDDTLEECRGSSFIVPEYADTFSTPTFSAYWFPSNKGGATGNVIWDVKHSSGVTDGNSWNIPIDTTTAGASAGYAGFARTSYVSWQPTGSGIRKGHGSMASMGWNPMSEVNFWVCREGGNAADTLVGDSVLKNFLIRVPMR